MGLVSAAALAIASAACGQGDSDNVMAPQANALSAEQVDLALGPEIANTGGNELEATNDMNELEATNDMNANTSVDPNNAAESVPTDNHSAEQ